jgi:hydrogenase/urease accessory protein HupE
MRSRPPKLQPPLAVALSLVAALTLTLLASGAFAHTGVDGGGHHDLVNMTHHLSDLDAWLATLTLEAWIVLPPLLALCAWVTVRWLHKKSKRSSSSRSDPQRKDQP